MEKQRCRVLRLEIFGPVCVFLWCYEGCYYNGRFSHGVGSSDLTPAAMDLTAEYFFQCKRRVISCHLKIYLFSSISDCMFGRSDFYLFSFFSVICQMISV